MKTTSLAAIEVIKQHRRMCNCDNAHGVCQLFAGLIDSFHDEVVDGYKANILALEYDLESERKARPMLLSEIVGYKAQVAGQAHYIKCLLDEVRELKERIAEFAKGA